MAIRPDVMLFVVYCFDAYYFLFLKLFLRRIKKGHPTTEI